MPRRIAKGLFDFAASYLFACILLGLLFVLTLLGTLEQVDHGLHEVQKKYFNSLFLVHPITEGFGVPLPGAALVLALLTVNVVLGGLVRIRKSKATLGVMVIHVGIVIMMAAGLVKLTAAEEGHLTLYEGQRSDEYVSYYLWEVAVFRANELEDVVELVVPDEYLRDLVDGRTAVFTSPDLPFEFELSNFVPNGRPMPKGPMWHTPHPVVDGYALRELPLEEEAEANVAGLYVTVRGAGREPLRGILGGLERYPWVCEWDDELWAFSLRHKRYQMPYTIVLDDFTRELHPRTGIAKSFMSDVTKLGDGDDRSLRIEMNEPLRAGGLVLFQASWGPSNAGPNDPLFSTFAVVRNPSDYWPLYSCIVIGVGLLITFARKLYLYTRSQNAKRASSLERVAA